MKKKFVALLAVSHLVLFLVGANAFAALTEWKFSFTGADLLNNVFVNGADGSNPVDNDLFDGARLLRVGTDGNHANAARTYVANQHDKFNERWAQYSKDGYVLDAFNLWGLDGRGAGWGEDYKPYAWDAHSGPDDWHTGFHTYSDYWGSPPTGYITDDFPWWYSPDNPLPMDALDLASYVFTFSVIFDDADMWWKQNVGNAPNALPELTFWFGGYLTKYGEDGNYTDYHLYEGNMVLTGTPVPEPATMLLLGAGLLGLAGLGRKFRKS